MKLKKHESVKDVSRLLGMVQHYITIWESLSHIIEPLIELTEEKKNKTYVWSEECNKVFDQNRQLLAEDAMLTYPN